MPLIDVETAREYAAKAHEARRRNAATKREAEECPPAIPPGNPAGDYTGKRLERVRTQLDGIDAAIDAILAQRDTDGNPVPPDPKQLDQFASASARLSEIERLLAGRPMPGSLRPVGEKSRPGRAEELLGG